MKLAHWHKSNGDTVYLTRSVERGLFEPDYDLVYGSVIFTKSQKRLKRLLTNFLNAIVGGTGTNKPVATIEQITGDYEHYDYSIYPDYKWSLGFTQRGCRLNCKFCVVPQKEGRPRSVNTIYDIWRPDTERKIVLLDNDFFGQPRDQWQARIDEIRSGDFKVSFNQGINIRLVDDEAAKALASIKYYDDQFKNRRLYTAWDNLKDEDIFFRGVDRLERAGIPPYHLMVYMLIGYDPTETWERILYRFRKMDERGILPYPMVYNNKDKELKRFQRWVVGRYYKIVSWEKYSNNGRNNYKKVPEQQLQLL
jgi:hypothetical protein